MKKILSLLGTIPFLLTPTSAIVTNNDHNLALNNKLQKIKLDQIGKTPTNPEQCIKINDNIFITIKADNSK